MRKKEVNILMPVNGKGKRFKEDGYTTPKPLINIQGKPMIVRVLESLNVDSDINIFIAYSDEFSDYNFEEVLRHHLPDYNFSFYECNETHRGPAETVVWTLEKIHQQQLKYPFMVIDCDNIISDNVVRKYRTKGYGNSIFYFKDTNPKPLYSYIKLDENNKVIDIKEKEKISDNANVGCYCFENGKELLKYGKKVLKLGEEADERGEIYYLSDVYEVMLQDNKEIKGIEISDFNCVGTPIQLKHYAAENTLESKRICFDLDNTLVMYPQKKGDYSTVKPIEENIAFARYLKSKGHTIIIYSARRMRTHNGNVGSIIADIGKETIDTLDKFNIPYDEVYFGKPYADFYVDDLAVKPQNSLSKQLGFYDINISSRDFNEIIKTGNYVIKQGDIAAERYYYENIPMQLSHYFPNIIDYKEKELVMSKVEGVTLSYLFTNKELTVENLNNVLDAFSEFHNISTEFEHNIYANYADKFEKRISMSPLLKEYKDFTEEVLKYLKIYEGKQLGREGVIHGDAVLTNMIYDYKGDLKFVDVRGKLGNNYSIYGDIFYDYAKLYQSLSGYDFIHNSKDADHQYINKILNYYQDFITREFSEGRIEWIKLLAVSLYLSLIPLHSDTNKCRRYIEVAKRIFNSIDFERI